MEQYWYLGEYSKINPSLMSSTIAIGAFHGLRHCNRLSNTIVIIDGVSCIGSSRKGNQMALVILVTEVWRLAKAAGGLRVVSGLVVTQSNIGALVVVSLRGVFLLVVGVEDVEDRETGADQSDTTLGITGYCQIWRDFSDNEVDQLTQT